MANKQNRPAEIAAPTGTITITLPDYNMFSGEEQEKFRKVMELIGMAVQANGLNNRDSDNDPENTLPTMFNEFSGHVSTLKFRCHMNGYRSDCDSYNNDEYQERTLKLDAENEKFFRNADSITKWLHSILMGMKNHDA